MPETPEPRTVEVDGYAYTIRPLDAWAAVPVFRKCVRVLLPALDELGLGGAALAKMVENMADEATDFGVIARIATRAGAVLVKQLDDADLRYCLEAFAGATEVHIGDKKPGLKGIFGEHFRGRLTSVGKWFGYCLEVNFGDFLEVARSVMSSARVAKPASSEGAAATATSPSTSPETSTGSSGA